MKIRSALVFLLSAALIVLGAVLPRLVGNRQDAENENRVEFASVNEVQLEFEESGMTMREKLAMSCNFTEGVVIPDQLTTLGRDKALKAAEQTAEQYRQAGLISQEMNFSRNLNACTPMLLFGDGESSGVYWEISLIASEAEWVLYMMIDDQTGRVCRIEYTDNVWDVIYSDMEDALYQFCDLYLTGLGEEFYEYDSRQLADNAKKPADSSYMAAEASWSSESGSGGCRLTLFLRTNGFYTYLNAY